MAYTNEAVSAKLSALNETQEGIVTVAQWIMFHRRHAEQTSQLWMQKLRDSTASKKLNLIYLVNEVVQQSKARRKNEFVVAFSPVMVEAVTTAYRGATQDIQQKLRRVIEVWRHRNIFDQGVQTSIEQAVTELDKNRGTGKKPGLGGSLFSSSITSAPPELEKLASSQTSLSKAEAAAKPVLKNAEEEYAKYNDPSKAMPSPPVQAAQLSTVLKCLARAEGAVTESMKARKTLIDELQTLLERSKNSLKGEEERHERIKTQYAEIETKKREVEDAIMRGLSEEGRTDAQENSAAQATVAGSETAVAEPERPVVEELTPPPTGSLDEDPPAETVQTKEEIDGGAVPPSQNDTYRQFNGEGNALPNDSVVDAPGALSATDILSGLTSNYAQPHANNGAATDGVTSVSGSAKRRKLTNGGIDDIAEFKSGDVMDEIDDDVAAMLNKD